MKMILKEWALRHDFGHHSNPKSKDRAKIFFDKCFLRPSVNEAWEILKSDTNDIEARKRAKAIIGSLDPQNNGSDNCAMLCGRLVQTFCDSVLTDNTPVGFAQEDMLNSYENYQPRVWDNGEDKEKYGFLKDTLVATALNALEGIKEATYAENRVIPETDLYKPMAGNELPYFTKPDYNRKGELKTKWARKNSRSKTGYSSASLPKSFGMFEQSHLWQVAGVWALNGHQPVWLLYVTDSDYLIFNETNCEELRPENLQEVAKKIMQYNKVTEKLLKTAKTKSELFEMVSPDYDKLCWNDPPIVTKHANILFDDGYETARQIDYEKIHV